VIRDCLNGSDVTSDCVTAIGVIGMLPTVLLLNEEGAPLRPSIQQNDARTTEEIEALNATLDPQTLFEMTGAALRQQSVRPKLLWLQRYEPEIWAQTRHIVGSYSYIAARLTDVITAEINWALESALYDPNSELWAAELPASAHVPDALVPHIHRPAES
jgi:xylulokinase